jgi:ribosome recycling factor
MPHNINLEAKDEIAKCLMALQNSFDTKISSNIHPNMIANIKIAYNGDMINLNHLANISLEDATTLSVKPWDKHALKSIEKSLHHDNPLSLSISSIGNGSIIVTMPSLTTDKRREWGKLAKTLGEEAKISIRHIRRNCVHKIEGILNETEQNKLKKQIEITMSHANDRIKIMVDAKQKSLEL